MLNAENALIPFSVSPLPAGPWLVFAPHADDETYGMGGSLLRARDAGIAVHVVVVTDGALGGDSEDLVQVRRDEVNEISRRLRLASLTHWAEPDRGVQADDRLMAMALAAIERTRPGAVFFPGPLELHPDHRAVGLLVWGGLQQSRAEGIYAQALAFEIGVQNPANMLIDITSCQAEKADLMAVYGSQNSQNNYPDLVTALDKGRTFTLPREVAYAEAFYRYSESDLNAPLAAVTHRIIDLYL